MLVLTALAISLGVIRNQTGEIVTQRSSTAAVVDTGIFKIQYEPRKNLRKRGRAQSVREDEQLVAAVIADFNNRMVLPFDIPVIFSNCRQPDSYYDQDTRQIVICHQLIEGYYGLFATRIKEKDRLAEHVKGAITAMSFHELGHALIDAWKLPTTGKEEDAADQLSTLMLMNWTVGGERMVLASAYSFKLFAELSKGEGQIYWDEHSLDEQRYYDTLCMLYGHNAKRFGYLVKNGTLPEGRSRLCVEDYARLSRSWRTLLAPHLKDGWVKF